MEDFRFQRFIRMARSWDTLPDLVVREIMINVGLDSLVRLHGCRQVCQTWNRVILHLCHCPRWKRIMKEKIQRNWGPGRLPSEEEISLARMLGDFLLFDKFYRHQRFQF